MSDGICYCNPQMATDGTISHAINCPLRPTSMTTFTHIFATAYSTHSSSEWQRGYDAGYAAGLAKAKER